MVTDETGKRILEAGKFFDLSKVRVPEMFLLPPQPELKAELDSESREVLVQLRELFSEPYLPIVLALLAFSGRGIVAGSITGQESQYEYGIGEHGPYYKKSNPETAPQMIGLHELMSFVDGEQKKRNEQNQGINYLAAQFYAELVMFLNNTVRNVKTRHDGLSNSDRGVPRILPRPKEKK